MYFKAQAQPVATQVPSFWQTPTMLDQPEGYLSKLNRGKTCVYASESTSPN
jgi:hypothetical protein